MAATASRAGGSRRPCDQHDEHDADDDPEVGDAALARQADVHAPDAGDQGERQDDDADRR